MTVTNYVVPHSGFGEPRRLTVDAVNPEMFLQLLSLAENNRLPVSLCGHSSSGFRVRYEDDIVGVIPASQSADYTELDWIIDAGLTPQATAEISLHEDAVEETIPAFEVLLPEPGLCVPINVPPAQRWGMLDGDRALRITDFSAPTRSLPKRPAHLLVRLTNSRHFFRRAIEVRLDDKLIATVPRDRATWLSDTIAGFKHEGLIAIARAYFTPDDESPALTVYSTEGTPDTHVAVGTAGVIAAAAGAAAATATNTDRAHAAIAPIGGFQATGTAHTASSAATQGAQVLSLKSFGTAATVGSKITAASAGVKLACAASVAVIIGGTASFVSSVHALHSAPDQVADSALKEHTTALFAPGPAKNTEAHNTLSADDKSTEAMAAGVHRPENQERSVTPRTLDRTASSTPAEPTELSEPTEPIKLSEPTQRAELFTPEEAHPSLHNTHRAEVAPPAPRESEATEASAPRTSRLRHEEDSSSTTATSEPSSTRSVPTSSSSATPTSSKTPTSSTSPSKTTATTTPTSRTTTPVSTPRTSTPAESTTPAPTTSKPAASTTATPTTTKTQQSKPSTTSKPSTSPKPSTTAKPSTTPKPEQTSEPTPDRTPEPSREPEPTPEPTPDHDGWVIIIEVD
ncbi:hypothetical protein MHJ96_03230 [Corynebacterium aurimucosum]|nr:hypothetical protein [Corynebacterium aurimucosum]